MKNNTPKNIISLEFSSIYNIYKSEFTRFCENILIEEKNALLINFFHKINLILKNIYIKNSNINNKKLLEVTKKCENKFIKEIYTPMYNICSSSINKFFSTTLLTGKIIAKNGGVTNQYLSNFLPHCLKEKTALHICGNKFMHISSNNTNNNNTNYVICIWCKKCYFGNLIYMHCSYCNVNYFSKIIKYDLVNDEILYPATWEKYHCDLMKNEQMSCIKCDQKLWIKNNNKLFCKKCKIEIEPLDIYWTCNICKKDFKSQAKIYNSLEYKEIKLRIRDAILYKKITKPENMPCKCIKEEEIDKTNFFHENSKGCKGLIYYTQLGNKHLVVCSSCSIMYPLNEFKWCCPFCKKYFLVNSVKIYNNKKYEKTIYNDNFTQEEYKKLFYNKKNIRKIEKIQKRNKILINLTNIENINKSNNDYYFNSLNNGCNKSNKKRNITSEIINNNNSLTDKNNNDLKSKNKKVNNILEIITKKEKNRKKYHKNNESHSIRSSINNFNSSRNKISELNSFMKYKANISNSSKEKNNMKSRNKKNILSTLFSTFNESYLIKKRYTKGLTIILNKNYKKSLLKFDKEDNNVPLNKSNKNNLSANKSIINKIKKNAKNNSKDKIKKENSKITNINGINKSKINLSNLNFTKKSCSNYNNLFPIFQKKGKSKIMKILSRDKTNISLRESYIIKRKYEINKTKNNSKDNKLCKDNYSYSKIRYLKKNKNFFKAKRKKIKRELSLPQKLENKKLIEKNIISNIKFKIKNTSEPKLCNKNNNIFLNIINKNNNYHKKSNEKNNISEELYYNNSLFPNNKINKNYSLRMKSEYINKNNNLPNKKALKSRNIHPILKEDNFTNTLLYDKKNLNSNFFTNINKTENNLFNFIKDIIENKNNENNMRTKNFHKNIQKSKKIFKKITKNKGKEKKLKKHEKNPNNINDSFDRKNLSNGLSNYKEEKDKIKSFNLDDYKIITQLGQGTFSKIYLVQDKDKNLFSMKKIILSDELDVHSVIKEYKICSNYKHENIVDLLGLYSNKLDKTTYVVYILMELGKTDWEKEIRFYKDKNQYYSEKDLIKIVKQLTSALSYLQNKNIVHRDIKPQNIIIFKDNKYKLADFGESKQLHNITSSLANGSLRGTELYMSPLLFNGLRNGQIDVAHNVIKSDVYSLGLCLFYAATLSNKSLYDVREFIEMKGLDKYIESILKGKYSKKFIELIISMLEIHEEKRPDFIELEKMISKNF